MNAAQDATKLLNQLIQTLTEGTEGFKTAAGAIDDPTLRDELLAYSAQRKGFAEQLQSVVAAAGEKPADRVNAPGVLHRAWINLKYVVSANDRHAILVTCERGEKAALEEYRKAIEVGSPAEFDPVITNQLAAVRATHARIKSLCESAGDS
jgi:uncharacterized protein (TIGR02284 family)